MEYYIILWLRPKLYLMRTQTLLLRRCFAKQELGYILADISVRNFDWLGVDMNPDRGKVGCFVK